MRYLEIKSYEAILRISRIAFGTGSNIKTLSDSEILRLFDLYGDAGGNCLDTAPGYVDGRSESLIGKWHTQRGNRSRIVISTKAGNNSHDMPEQGRLSRKDLVDDLNTSLQALRTDYVDIFWLHKDDPTRPVQDIIESINEIIRSGRVRMVGCSNWRTERIEAANSYARETGQHGFLASQIQWSVAQTREEDFAGMGVLVMHPESYSWYLANRMPVFGFTSQAQGFFAKMAHEGIASLSEEMKRRYASMENCRRAANVARFAAAHHVSTSATALAYIINNKLPGVAIISCKSQDHLEDSLTAADMLMSESEADQLLAV